MTITIRLKTDNAAFEDDRDAEVERILRKYLLHGGGFCPGSINVLDANGNRVGSVTVTGK